MSKKSAGILFYRFQNHNLEVLLVHPGGPLWAGKDPGAWSIPKGEFEENEDPLEAARREVEEEMGIKVSGNFIKLTPVKQKGGKLVYAWAVEGDFDPDQLKSNSFEIEWPPKSGKLKSFPEVDKAVWMNTGEAKQKINVSQANFIDELANRFHRSVNQKN